MSQAYSNPKRAADPHALPDVEVFYNDGDLEDESGALLDSGDCRPYHGGAMNRRFRTPWGDAQTVRIIGVVDGYEIRFASTASHGGFHVPVPLLKYVPAAHQAYAAKWSGARTWYEEDCAAACVIAAFPHLFDNKEDHEYAITTLARLDDDN